MVNQIKEDIFQAIEEMRKEEYPAYDAIIDDEGLEDFADNIDDYGVCSGGGVFGDQLDLGQSKEFGQGDGGKFSQIDIQVGLEHVPNHCFHDRHDLLLIHE